MKIIPVFCYDHDDSVAIGYVNEGTLFKGSQLDAFSPQAIVYCYLEYKLSYLKNLIFFFN